LVLEYIGQLEGEVAQKVQELSTCRSENAVLVEENTRYRALIETLLRHPSFVPFIDDFSKHPAFIASQASRQEKERIQQQQQARLMNDAARKASILVSVPETSLDVSMLNINTSSNNLPLSSNTNTLPLSSTTATIPLSSSSSSSLLSRQKQPSQTFDFSQPMSFSGQQGFQ